MKAKMRVRSPVIEIRSASRAVIVIDDAPMRSAAAKELSKLFKSYSKHLSELAHHENKVRPSYYQWLAGLFSERLSRLQRLQAELIQKSYLLQRMRELCIFDGFSRSSAFDRAQEEMEAERQSEEDMFFEDEGGPADDPSEEEIDESVFEELEREFFAARGARTSEPAENEQSLASKAKYFYRKLAQALHPDLSGEQTEFTRELWTETLDAYKKLDIEHLKMIWTLVSAQKNAVSREVRLFDLKAATDHLKSKLRSVKNEKRQLSREDPSWGFEKKDKKDLESDIRSELDREEDTLSSALEDVEEDLEVFSKSSGGKRKRSGRDRMDYGY